jgi:photosystem II stability/assembly factor-like uncharacterized protein
VGLERESVTALHAEGDVLLAGTYGGGLFRSPDGGRSWEHIEAGLTASTFRFVSGHLAGTEPAQVYRSSDGGRSWEEFEEITRIPGHERWFLPYSPRAGAARNASVSGDRLLVAAEVAGLLRSDDGGRTWVCEPVAGDEDVHHVSAHPRDPNLVYASLGSASLSRRGGQHGGIGRSRDGGRTWKKVETDYARATIIPPAGPRRSGGTGRPWWTHRRSRHRRADAGHGRVVRRRAGRDGVCNLFGRSPAAGSAG